MLWNLQIVASVDGFVGPVESPLFDKDSMNFDATQFVARKGSKIVLQICTNEYTTYMTMLSFKSKIPLFFATLCTPKNK